VVAGLVAVAGVAACSGGDGGTEPTPTIDIALSQGALSVVQGASGTVNVTLTRGGGFAGAVDIDISGEPTGVTATATPIASGATSSVITVTAGATAAPGTANLTVRATGAGVSEKTQTLALTITAAPAGSYTLAVAPATVTVQQGATGTANVTVTRTGGFTGAVALTAQGLPNGVTAAFDPASVTTSNASALTLTVGAGAAAGTSTVTVKGTATGQADKTATFQLTITAAPAGGYTLAVAPAAVTVQQGASGTATVNITRTGGFAGAVTLAATGLPNGVTAAFNPAAPTTNTSTLTLTASGTAALGQATVTITGTAAGIANQTATLALTVTAATGGSGNTTWNFCTADSTPVWFAVQDGNGAWTRVTPTGTTFQFNIASGRGGVAYVRSTSSASVSGERALARRMSAALETTLLMRNKALAARTSNRYAASAGALADEAQLTITYGTQAELNASGTSQCLPGTGKTVNGSVAGVGAQQTATVSLGPSSDSPQPGTTTFQLTDVPDGALDLVASRNTTDLTTFASVPDKIIIRRGVNAANNSTLPVLDFNAAEAFAPAQANITIGNLGTDMVLLITSYVTSGGVAGAALLNGSQTGAGPFKYYGVPTARQAAGDLHFAFATALNQAGDEARLVGTFFKDPTDRTVTLGAALPAPTVSSVATAPNARFRATGSLTTAYNKYVAVTFTQATAGGGARNVSIEASAAYLNNATSYDFTIPDFSGVAGWNDSWGLQSGVETTWTVTGIGFTGIGFDTPNPVEGATFMGALRSGTI
jgi:hypothetical protein